MRIVFLDAATIGDDISAAPIASLGDYFPYPETHEEDVAARVADADIIITNKMRLGAQNLCGARHLRLICVTATGYDNIDVNYAKSRGIAVCNVVGYSTESVVQVTFALALSLMTHLPTYNHHVTSKAYEMGNLCNCVSPYFHELAGKTWGIVGYGHIGTRVGAVASAFGCRVVVASRSAKTGVEQCDLPALLEQSDIVSLHVPLCAETRGMIGSDELSIMKEGAILINVARGAVVDEAAVADAVLANRILYGSDVYGREPLDRNHPVARLYESNGACLTPHMAWGAVEARERCILSVAENIRAFLSGEKKSRVD